MCKTIMHHTSTFQISTRTFCMFFLSLTGTLSENTKVIFLTKRTKAIKVVNVFSPLKFHRTPPDNGQPHTGVRSRAPCDIIQLCLPNPMPTGKSEVGRRGSLKLSYTGSLWFSEASIPALLTRIHNRAISANATLPISNVENCKTKN